jgi:hypothetical protein
VNRSVLTSAATAAVYAQDVQDANSTRFRNGAFGACARAQRRGQVSDSMSARVPAAR